MATAAGPPRASSGFAPDGISHFSTLAGRRGRTSGGVGGSLMFKFRVDLGADQEDDGRYPSAPMSCVSALNQFTPRGRITCARALRYGVTEVLLLHSSAGAPSASR
jgi:hypothetical protein